MKFVPSLQLAIRLISSRNFSIHRRQIHSSTVRAASAPFLCVARRSILNAIDINLSVWYQVRPTDYILALLLGAYSRTHSETYTRIFLRCVHDKLTGLDDVDEGKTCTFRCSRRRKVPRDRRYKSTAGELFRSVT